MDINAKIYVAGHRGLVGSALVRCLQSLGYTNLITRTHRELDLTRQAQVERFFQTEKPDYVLLAAAKVGGIWANSTRPAEFSYINVCIQSNVIHAAWQNGVKRLLFLGSSCIYPHDCPQPMREEHLLTGPLEPTNEPYALAKIVGISQCESYNRQHGTQYLAVMPTNLYGPNDNYDLVSSHVLAALIRKFHLAKLAATGDRLAVAADEQRHGPIPPDIKQALTAIGRSRGHELELDMPSPPDTNRQPGIVLWGTGTPRREFLHVDDLAAACIFLLNLDAASYASIISGTHRPLVNIGCGEDLTIRDLASQIAATIGYQGKTVWDTSKPDGTPRKLLDISKLKGLGWKRGIALEEGIKKTYEEYLRV